MKLRAPGLADARAIRMLLVEAFGGPAEADLVDKLRADGDAEIELIAKVADRLVGHILFSPIEAPMRALALAPVAVKPDRQRQGIGSTLIAAGHRLAGERGFDSIFVLGDPAYYGRFGYSVEAAAAFDCAYRGPHFMMLQLADLPRVSIGRLDYAPAFRALG